MPRPDFRALLLGVVAWAAAYVGLGGSPWWLAVAALLALRVRAVRRAGRDWVTPVGWLLAGCAVFGSALLQSGAVARTPLQELGSANASAQVEAEVRTDPVRTSGRFADQVYFDAVVLVVTARGQHFRLHTPVLVLMPADGPILRRGTVVRLAGRLSPSDRPDRAAILTARSGVQVLATPRPLDRGAGRVRAAVRDAAAPFPPGPRALVPALVDGDDGGLDERVVADFRTTGLTHLMAVSGTNLTLILGAVLLLARGAGVRGRGLIVVGALGVVGFVLLAGPQPSVLRAAAMGSVALLGLGVAAQQRGLRALGVGVMLLLAIDPWLARSVGFALSATATAGILLLGPLWRDALARWLPVWVAEAVAVPLAAQISCTPLVAAISGQVSLVAVAANIAAAPFVAPATVLGLAGGIAALVWVPLGQVVAAPAGWCGSAIIAVAEHAAGLPLPAIGWSTAAPAQVLLVLVCVAGVLRMHLLLVRRAATLVTSAILVVVVLVPVPVLGWPPPGWVLVACSVGQGDGLVLNLGAGSGVVVDAGPDPGAVDRCLRRLRVRAVPVVVLTHLQNA